MIDQALTVESGISGSNAICLAWIVQMKTQCRLRRHSITCLIVVGPQQGCKVITLHTLSGIGEPFDGCAGQRK